MSKIDSYSTGIEGHNILGMAVRESNRYDFFCECGWTNFLSLNGFELAENCREMVKIHAAEVAA